MSTILCSVVDMVVVMMLVEMGVSGGDGCCVLVGIRHGKKTIFFTRAGIEPKLFYLK